MKLVPYSGSREKNALESVKYQLVASECLYFHLHFVCTKYIIIAAHHVKYMYNHAL